MPNIIDGINKMKNEQLSWQLATLKTVTMANMFSEMGQKASNRTVKAFNGLRKIFDKKPVKEPEVIPLKKRITDCQFELSMKSREELIRETRNVLIEKISYIESIQDNLSDDALSVLVIEAACKNFKNEIDEEFSPAQKADSIYYRYNERLLSQTQKEFAKSSESEKEEITKKLQEEIDSLSEEQKEEMRKALKVDELKGETLKKVLTSSAGTSALLIALNASGFGAFMALTTIMHAVFTTTLQITLPFAVYTTSTSILSFLLGPFGWILFAGMEIFALRSNKNKLMYELMSQVVWSSVLECGGRFTPKEESLPSWLPEEQRKVVLADNKEFMDLQRKFNSLQEEYNKRNNDIEEKSKLLKDREIQIISLNKKVCEQINKIDEEKKNKHLMEMELNDAKAEFNKYTEYVNNENEELFIKYKEAKIRYNQAEDNLLLKNLEIIKLQENNQYSQDTIKMYEEEIDRVALEKNVLQQENAQMKDKLEKIKTKSNAAETREVKRLENNWKIYYKDFEFDNRVIKSVVKNYEYNEYAYIERRLTELHEAQDPAALENCSLGKMNNSREELHIKISGLKGVPSRIFYLPLKETVNGKRVRITRIEKHNDSRYGKSYK